MPNPIGHRRLTFDEVASTNTIAVGYAAEPGMHGLVVTAASQSAGRGQYDRVWQAPSGSSVLLSVLLFPTVECRRPALLTAWAAESVCATIADAIGLDATLKWPNDVLLNGRKVCGILCEAGTRHLVAGIGLNANQSADDFARLNLPDATSLAIETGRPIDVADLTERLIARLDTEYTTMQTGSLEERWRDRFRLLGKTCVLEMMDGRLFVGRLRMLSFQAIGLETEDETLTLPPEAVRHVRPASLPTSLDCVRC